MERVISYRCPVTQTNLEQTATTEIEPGTECALVERCASCTEEHTLWPQEDGSWKVGEPYYAPQPKPPLS
jgi:hypothetical protein